MNRIVLLTLALAAAGASTAVLAQQHAPVDGHARAGKHQMHKRHGGGIARLDVNQDGRIARNEVAGEGRHLERLSKQFDAIDANRDGFLVRTELQAWHQAARAQRHAERTERHAQRFADADLNHDGKLSKVEASEKMPRLANRFAWIDENRDGYLSRDELQPRRRR